MAGKRRVHKEEENQDEETPVAEVAEEEEEEVMADDNDDTAVAEEAADAAVAEDDASASPPSPKRPRRSEQQQEEEEATASPPAPSQQQEDSPPRSAPRPLNRPGESATVGIIQQVKVENFMCHRKLRVDLCRNINFIHGQNGSGKSAILAALQICLGAGARRTHRARNLAALVRTDHVHQPTHAKLSVSIRNEGQDAFRHDAYGDKITVERTIALKPGSTYNGYKLLNAAGKEVSRARKDLDEMLDHMNIQVENPVAILDQEEAKKFLTGKATDKYKFFMNACELERLDRAYAKVVDDLSDVQEAKDRIADGIESERQHVQELKRQYLQHRELDKLQTKLLTEQCKMAWAMHNTHAQELQIAQDKRQDFETKAALKRQELSQVEQLTQESTTDHDQVSARLQELSTKAQEVSAEKAQLQAAVKQALQPLRAAESAVKQAERREKQARKDLAASQQRLQEALDELKAQNDDDADLAAQLAQREQDLAEAREQDMQLKHDITESHHQYQEVEPLAEQARRSHQEAERKFQAARDKLAEMQRASGDSLSVFGPRVKKLRSEMERRKKEFRGPVVGPIGAYLKICPGKEAYAPLAELALGTGMMDRFIVTNNHDRKLLQQIRKRVGCNRDCSLFLMSNDDTRFSIPAPPPGIETPATVLKIDHDLVFNCLVDNARIESVALCKDKDKSEQSLIIRNDRNEKAIKAPIKNVFCLPRGDSWSIRRGQQSIISNDKSLKQTIGADKTGIIRQLKREMEALEDDARAAEKEADNLNGQHSELKAEWNRHRRSHRNHLQLMSSIQEKIDKIKAEMDAVTGQEVDTSEYEEDVHQQRKNVDSCIESTKKAKEECEKLKPAVDEAKARFAENARMSEKVVAELNAAEGDMTKHLETQSQHKDSMAKKRQKIEKYENAIRLHNEKIDKIQKEVDDYLYKARKIHFRMTQRKNAEENAKDGDELPEELMEPTDEDLEAIEIANVPKDAEHYEAKAERTKERIEAERQKRRLTNEDPTEAYEKFIEARNAVSKKLEEINKLDKTIREHNQDLKARQTRWKQFRIHLEKKTAERFSQMLDINGYEGDLRFDNETKELMLDVQKQNSAESQTNDVKALSGGERSYTTISLLLALGESLETPFRCADEFDVFLDVSVRKMVIELLIFTARKKLKHRQFIFLTPQDLSSVTPAPDLKIFHLLPPERNNHNASLTQQTL